MTIKPISRRVYAVKSSPNDKQTVDAAAFDWNGSCTCGTFTGCCLPLLVTTRKRWRCPHILAVREWIMEHEYPEMIERSEKIIELPTRSRPAREEVGL